MERKKQSATFYYGALRDIIGLIGSIFWAVIFFFAWKALVNFIIYICEFPEEFVDTIATVCIWIYVVICCLILVYELLSIYISTRSFLVVSKNHVTFHSGLFTKEHVTVPVNKIRTCTKRSGIIQRLCDTMDIYITTAGDSHEIAFLNIIDGDEAYKLICEFAEIITSDDTNLEDA